MTEFMPLQLGAYIIITIGKKTYESVDKDPISCIHTGKTELHPGNPMIKRKTYAVLI